MCLQSFLNFCPWELIKNDQGLTKKKKKEDEEECKQQQWTLMQPRKKWEKNKKGKT